MARSTSFRLILAIAVFIGMLILLALTLSAAQFTLTLWHQLQTAPVWVVALIALLCSLLLGFGLWLSWRIVRPTRAGKPATQQPLTEAELQSQLESASAAGVNVDTALQELEELARRREVAKRAPRTVRRDQQWQELPDQCPAAGRGRGNQHHRRHHHPHRAVPLAAGIR